MTSVPVAPPPCPPPPVPTHNISGEVKRNAKFRVSSDGFDLPNSSTELRQACNAAGLLKSICHQREQKQDCNSRSVLLCHYSQVEPLIQDGPKCGLVALCMASQLVCQKTVQLEDVFALCKQKGYTQKGEMFSVAAMADAAMAVCCCDVTLIQDVSSNQDKLIYHLMKGSPVLFPYDADRNHGPGIRNGQAAHWAVFTGVVIKTSVDIETIEQFYKIDSEVDCLYNIRSKNNLPLLNNLCPQEVYVCGRQGKSNYMRLWKLSEMIASSSQMKEISQDVLLNELHSKILPEGFESLQKDLANQAICLN